MCGRLVNIDTVARVLADYYHLKTGTQLAALDEALSKVPSVSVGGGHGKDHVADPNKMVGDLISRAAAVDALGKRPVVWTDKIYYILGARNQYDKDRLAIETVPSSQQWIPCSRELPKEEERSYWVCMEDGYQKQCRWKRYEGKDCYIYAWHSTMKVIAWMPLPEPWKGEKE